MNNGNRGARRLPTKSLPLLIACLLAVTVAHAQQQQTAEGAQKFLASLKTKGADIINVGFLDGNGANIPLQGTETYHSAWLRGGGVEETAYKYQPDPKTSPITKPMQYLMGVVALDAVNSAGKPDACVTRVEKIYVSPQEKLADREVTDGTFPEKKLIGYKDSPIRWYHEWQLEDPAQKFAGPHYIEWSKAKVSRTTNGARILVTAPGPKFWTQLVLVPGDPDLADRVEYAAKFLQMSCDATASTGF
ncbi:MAG: hypothetical protein ABUU24_03185 [Variovorax sp.]